MNEQYIHGAGLGGDVGSMLFAQKIIEQDGQRSVATSYYIHNHRGDVIAVTDESGNPVETYRYTAFGELIGADHPEFGFSSKRYDIDTGLSYFNARYYDATVGRFISRDPLGYIDGPNGYIYVSNNPLNLIDPFGLQEYYLPTSIYHGLPDIGMLINPPAPPDPDGGKIVTPIPSPDPDAGRIVTPIPEPDPDDGKIVTPIEEPDPSQYILSDPVSPDWLQSFLTGRLDNSQRKFWKKTVKFQGMKVYQRDDLIDPYKKDHKGRTNIQRMRRGLAPYGPDGKPLYIHHLNQADQGPVAETTQTFNDENSKIIHINQPAHKFPSGIDRKKFKSWKKDYWKERAHKMGRCKQ